VAALALALVVPLAACGDSESEPQAAQASEAGRLPSAHVHGVAVNPADGAVFLATHDGLFRYENGTPTRVGPVIDLMGFTVVGPDHFYSSGHPGPDVDLPEPVGLLESTDAGRTWKQLSRQGESDFHALTASEAGVVGFDGTLRATSDGKAWRDLEAPAEPHGLAVSPDGKVVLGTAPTGLIRSGDAGATWTKVDDAPALMLVDWAEGDVVAGIGPEGEVAVSDDGGLTWDVRGTVEGLPHAIGASGAGPDLLVATGTELLRSDDGESFRPYP
jgi:photosystem II stability/assembly factor-like uncharacterized protein